MAFKQFKYIANKVKEKNVMDRLENPLEIDNILKPAKIGLIVLLVAVVTILCRVEIKDEGPGIKPEHMSSIFKPFFTT